MQRLTSEGLVGAGSCENSKISPVPSAVTRSRRRKLVAAFLLRFTHVCKVRATSHFAGQPRLARGGCDTVEFIERASVSLSLGMENELRHRKDQVTCGDDTGNKKHQ